MHMAVYTVECKTGYCNHIHEFIGSEIAIAFVYGSRVTCKSSQLREPAHILNAFEDKSPSIKHPHIHSLKVSADFYRLTEETNQH